MTSFKSEVEMAAHVVAYLRDLRWEVYQEVDGIDIVATQGSLVWIVECKLGLTLSLLSQLEGRRGRAHLYSAAVPTGVSTRVRGFAEGLLRERRWGLLVVCAPTTYTHPVREAIRPRLHRARRRVPALRSMLRDEHKSYCAAGTSSGGAWTPFKATCNAVLIKVQGSPGIAMKELVGAIDHHYRSNSSARLNLTKWIAEGLVPGVMIRRDNGRIGVWPKEKA